MKQITKTILIGFIAGATILSGCAKTTEIRVSEDVKEDTLVKAEDNKIRNEPVLKKKLNGLENQRILFWIDDENILTCNQESLGWGGGKLILYSYNLESEESTEILNNSNITRIYYASYNIGRDGLILLGNNKQAFVFDPKERKLEEVLDLDKEFKAGVPGSKKPKEEQDLRSYNVQLIKHNYISYVSKLNRKNNENTPETAEYTILNYKDNKKYTLDERYSMAGIDCEFDLTGKNIYIGQFSKLTKLNIETEEKSSMELSMPHIQNIFEDGTLFVQCIEENGTAYDKERLYKVDFDNKKVTRYDENYEGKNMGINLIDFKNQFVCYTCYGDDRKQNISMYGKIEGNKFVVTDKLFKNNEDIDCNDYREFIFSLDHNKFIVPVSKEKTEIKNNEEEETLLKDDKYLFELK